MTKSYGRVAMNVMQKLILLVILSGVTSYAAADMKKASGMKHYSNPVLDINGTLADPHVILYKGVYYLYPTSDGKGYDVFISTDLVNWEHKGKCFEDERGGAWAPDVFHDSNGDGKFYLYYTLGPQFDKFIGVAVAEDPLGPFEDKGVLIQKAIDAHMYRDDDGKYYLYYVDVSLPNNIIVQPMENPATLSGEPEHLISPMKPWEMRGLVTEGPWMIKRNGTYYLMYSGSGADSKWYAIGYAISKSPVGPFKKHPGNPIAKLGNGVFGPGHHSVVQGPDGNLWMVYHQKVSEEQGWSRFLAIDPIWFDEKGVIHTRTTRGTQQEAP